MPSKKRSVKSTAHKASVQDSKFRTSDSFQNFLANMGIGTDNLTTGSTYGFNPITRVRTLLEWIHRGSWIGGVAVDLVADDMTRAGIELKGQLDPDHIEQINERAITLGIWNSINEVVKWSRLYGGCLGVYMVEGQDPKTPLRIQTVRKGMFRGILPLDRWMVEPDLTNLVTEPGPYVGMPKYYTVVATAPAMVNTRIHYTRCFRMIGVKVPYWQALIENLWGLSIIERLYDRMVAFDSATTGAAQLVYRSYLRTYKVQDLREVVAAGGDALRGLVQTIDMMRRFQSNEGITLVDKNDEFEVHTNSAFAGLSDALVQFGQQLAGALQIPLVRLFGMSPSGFNATGDSDIRMYYDGIRQQQESVLRVPVTDIYRMIAQSLGIELPEGFGIGFNPLWQMTDKEKADVASSITTTIQTAEESGLVRKETALQELRQQARITGIWSNITDEEIEESQQEGPPVPLELRVAEVKKEGQEESAEIKTKDSSARTMYHHGLQTVVENPKGTMRRGRNWEVWMPADYGYIQGSIGADGDQVDCYIGPSPESSNVYVVNQKKKLSNAFDEHKVMLGYYTPESALEDYYLGFNDGSGVQRIMGYKSMTMQDFKNWLNTGDMTKPV